jgi:Ras-related C3 botulinum toxin substrate 1
VIGFAINNRHSFRNVVSKWIPEIRQHAPGVPILLLGTKIDLRYDQSGSGQDIVSSEEGQQLVEEHDLQGYLEFSALAGIGLRELFDTAMRITISWGQPAPSGKRGRCHIQ